MEKYDLLELLQVKTSLVQNKIVILGYSTYRNWGALTNFVNTPWQHDGDDLSTAVPLHWVYAVGLENLLNHRWLADVAPIIPILQTILVFIACLYIWRFEVTRSVILFAMLWAGVLLLHSIMFSVFSIFVPLSDTAIFATIAVIVGGLYKMQHEGRLRAAQAVQTISQQQLDAMQGQFLNQFAQFMLKQSEKIQTLLQSEQPEIQSANSDIYEKYIRTKSSVQELQDYLNGMQQLSGLDVRQLRSKNRNAVFIKALLNKVIGRFDFRIHEKQLILSVSCDEGMAIHSDASIIEQIIYNLLSNAIKYSPNGANITITSEIIDKRFQLNITDHGPGIPDEIQQQIFEKFYRAMDDVNMQVKGHGLGLYLSQYFANAIDGVIRLRSKLGEGSTFTLELRKI